MKVRKTLYKTQKLPIYEGAKTSLQSTKSPTYGGAKQSPLKTHKVKSVFMANACFRTGAFCLSWTCHHLVLISYSLGEISLLEKVPAAVGQDPACLLYTSPSPRDAHESRMPSSA